MDKDFAPSGDAFETPLIPALPNRKCIAQGEWLSVSTEGFSEQQLGRPLAHLAKELVQNALDSVGKAGHISVRFERMGKDTARLSCMDDGPGSDDLSRLNIVFVTGKKDGVHQRGRMGRGFKELLSIASQASVRSHDQLLSFDHDEDGVRRVTLTRDLSHHAGFSVAMQITHDEVDSDLAAYFATFLVPDGVVLVFNGQAVQHRPAHKVVQARLTTERFVDGRWKKPLLATEVHLVPTVDGETGSIFEMGIPVCPVDWTEPFHCDVQQRVPMNPNRDAVQTGYAARLHRACLPSLLSDMTKERALSAWVGEAARGASNDLQKAVVHKAFGADVVRAVPTSGRFDHNADAEELGSTVVHTAHMPGGFRELLKSQVPTATVVARKARTDRDTQAAEEALDVDALMALDLTFTSSSDQRSEALATIGQAVVAERMLCAQWFCEAVAECRHGVHREIPVRVAFMKGTAATWSYSGTLTLSLTASAFWEGPFEQRAFLVLVHEMAHREAFHHGRSFPKEVEAYAGAAVLTMLRRGAEGQRLFPNLLQGAPAVPEMVEPVVVVPEEVCDAAMPSSPKEPGFKGLLHRLGMGRRSR